MYAQQWADINLAYLTVCVNKSRSLNDCTVAETNVLMQAYIKFNHNRAWLFKTNDVVS